MVVVDFENEQDIGSHDVLATGAEQAGIMTKSEVRHPLHPPFESLVLTFKLGPSVPSDVRVTSRSESRFRESATTWYFRSSFHYFEWKTCHLGRPRDGDVFRGV